MRVCVCVCVRARVCVSLCVCVRARACVCARTVDRTEGRWDSAGTFMSSESENTTPSYPSRIRRMSWMKTRDIVAGLPGSTCEEEGERGSAARAVR